MEGTIKIQTKEGKEIELLKKDAMLSELLKNTLTDYPDETLIPLTEVDEKTGEKIRDYLTHLEGNVPKEIQKPLISSEMKNVTDEWSASFIDKMLLDDLVNLTVAANYMGINSLLDLCCAKLASLCKDKTEEEIYKTFNITETFTEEEKEKIKQENKWIEENI